MNGKTPFHSKDRDEFEQKVDASNYQLKTDIQENVSLETILFMNMCLRHDEQERETVTQLIKHPYLNKPFM